jgi:PAS domain S-box-containing protein
MSTDTSVPHPRLSGFDASDSALFATLLREAPIGFALFDTDLRFERANESMARVHGVTVADLEGKKPSEVLADEIGEIVETAVRKVVDEDRPVLDVDLQIGDRHWAYSWFPSRADGRLTGVVLMPVHGADAGGHPGVVSRRGGHPRARGGPVRQ